MQKESPHSEELKALLDVIGANVKLLRSVKGMSQVELSQRAGVQRQYCWNLENTSRRNEPRMNTLLRIANALGVSVAQLCRPIRLVTDDGEETIKLR